MQNSPLYIVIVNCKKKENSNWSVWFILLSFLLPAVIFCLGSACRVSDHLQLHATCSAYVQFRCVCFAQASHSVHVFSVNGVNLGSKYVSERVTGLAVAGDHLVVVDDAGDLTMSRILG